MEIQAKDQVGVEQQPPPLLDARGRRPGDLADDRQRSRKVQVVIEGIDEPGVKGEAGGGQWSGWRVGPVDPRERRAGPAVSRIAADGALRAVAGGGRVKAVRRRPRSIVWRGSQRRDPGTE